MVDVSLGTVWRDAWGVYTLLFRRSVPTAALVYLVLESVLLTESLPGNRGVRVFLEVVFLLLFVTGVFVLQGALVAIVQDVHVAARPRSIRALLAAAWRRGLQLASASIVYALSLFVGLLLLIVPGLLVAARWCLMAPLIMLEDRDAGTALDRSHALVKGHTWRVLAIVVATFLVTTAVPVYALAWAAYLLGLPPWADWLLRVATAALAAPFTAHILTVIYYRITDPEHPVIHPDVRAWRSVWAGA